MGVSPREIPTAKPKLFCFCCEVFGFAMRYFVFAVRRWRAKVALFCLSCPSATFALQHGGLVARECLAAKGLSGVYGRVRLVDK